MLFHVRVRTKVSEFGLIIHTNLRSPENAGVNVLWILHSQTLAVWSTSETALALLSVSVIANYTKFEQAQG